MNTTTLELLESYAYGALMAYAYGALMAYAYARARPSYNKVTSC